MFEGPTAAASSNASEVGGAAGNVESGSQSSKASSCAAREKTKMGRCRRGEGASLELEEEEEPLVAADADPLAWRKPCLRTCELKHATLRFTSCPVVASSVGRSACVVA